MKTKAWMVVGLSLAVTLGASNESTTEARSTGFECNGCYGGVATFPVGPDTIEADAHEFDGNVCFPMDPDWLAVRTR